MPMFDMYVYRRGQRIWKGGGKIEKNLKIGLKIAAFHLTPPSAEGGGGDRRPPSVRPCMYIVHI